MLSFPGKWSSSWWLFPEEAVVACSSFQAEIKALWFSGPMQLGPCLLKGWSHLLWCSAGISESNALKKKFWRLIVKCSLNKFSSPERVLSLLFLPMGALWDAALKDLNPLMPSKAKVKEAKKKTSVFGPWWVFYVGLQCFWNRKHSINRELINWLTYVISNWLFKIKITGSLLSTVLLLAESRKKISFRHSTYAILKPPGLSHSSERENGTCSKFLIELQVRGFLQLPLEPLRYYCQL